MLLRYTRYMEHCGREESLRSSALKTITKHGFVNHVFTAMGGEKKTTLELRKKTQSFAT